MKHLWLILFVIVSWINAQESSTFTIYFYDDKKQVVRGEDSGSHKYFGEVQGSERRGAFYSFTREGYGVLILNRNESKINYTYNTYVMAGEHSIPTINDWIEQGQSLDGLYRPLDLQSVIDYLAAKYPDYSWAENIYKEIGNTKVSPPKIKRGQKYKLYSPIHKDGGRDGSSGDFLATEDILFDKNTKPPSVPNPSILKEISKGTKDIRFDKNTKPPSVPNTSIVEEISKPEDKNHISTDVKITKGFVSYAGGRTYEGDMKSELPHGQGVYTYPSGQKYVGEFKDGLYHGKGVLFKINREIQSGTWVNDNFEDKWPPIDVERFLQNKYPEKIYMISKLISEGYFVPTISLKKDDITELTPSPETLTNIAVVDFNGNNISAGETIALSDRLRIELVRTRYFTVIEREMMNEIIKEQGFQQSGCATDECMVQIGRLIGVEKILGGNISKVGNIYSVTSRIISVETGEIEKTEVYDHTGDIGQLLTNGMRMIAIGLTE